MSYSNVHDVGRCWILYTLFRRTENHNAKHVRIDGIMIKITVMFTADEIEALRSRFILSLMFDHKCRICDPEGHLIRIVRKRVHSALKRSKTLRSIEYLGCSIQHFRAYITVKGVRYKT